MEQIKKNVSPFSNESRNTYVIGHLTDALLELMEEKPFGEITISELCGRAGVGRTSFYRNFETKEAILKAHIRDLFQGWRGRLESSPALTASKSVYEVFSHFEANRSFYSLLYQQDLIHLVKDILLDLFGFQPGLDAVSAYSSAYVAFFLYGWIEVWFRRGMKETAAELSGYLENAEYAVKKS